MRHSKPVSGIAIRESTQRVRSNDGGVGARPDRKRRVEFERLEPRLLMSADVSVIVGGITAPLTQTVVTETNTDANHIGTNTVVDANADKFLLTPVPEDAPLAMHIHAQLGIVIDGQAQVIPAGIGIRDDGDLPIHTHDDSGTIHIESPTVREFHLQDVFTVWGQTFNNQEILGHKVDASHFITMTVTSEGFTYVTTAFGSQVLHDHDSILISYGEVQITQAVDPPPLNAAPVNCPAIDVGIEIPDGGWTWVDDTSDATRIKQITGIVNAAEGTPGTDAPGTEGSFVTFSDFPVAHNSHDQNMHIKVDQGQFGLGDYTGLLSITNDLEDPSFLEHLAHIGDVDAASIDPATQIEVEWETGIGTGETQGDGHAGLNGGTIFPKWAWANPGDRVWVMGNHIYDCGHPTRVDGEDRFKTEIHPPIAVASQRSTTDSLGNVTGDELMTLPGTGLTPVPVVATDLYIHGDGGFATRVLNQHDIFCPIIGECTINTTSIARDYSFDIMLPKKPAGASDNDLQAFSIIPAAADVPNSIGSASDHKFDPVLTPMLGDPDHPRINVKIPLAGSGVADLDTYARTIVAGWAVPQEGVRHLQIKLDQMVLHDDKSNVGDGRLSFFWLNVPNAANEWQRISDFANNHHDQDPQLLPVPCLSHTNTMDNYDDKGGGCGDGIMNFSGPTYDFFVMDGAPVRIVAWGYEQDCLDPTFGHHSPETGLEDVACLTAGLLDEGDFGDNDPYNMLNNAFLMAPNYNVGSLDLANPDGQYNLHFTITELAPPPQPRHFDLPAGGGTFEELVDGTDLVLRKQGGPELFRKPEDSVTKFTVNGSDSNDKLIVIESGGNPVPAGGLFFNGAGQTGVPGDSLALQGGSFNTITHIFINDHDGKVLLDPDGLGGVDASVITYTGLEPITDNLSAVNRIFNFTGAGETITVSDDPGAVAGVSRIDSTLGESVDFTNPTTTLAVNASAGTGPDTINVQALDAAFNANVSVNASSGGDHITLSATTGTTNSWTLSGGDGNDAISVDFGNLARPVDVQGNGGQDSLLVNGTASGDTIAITSSAVTRGSEAVTYASIENLTVDAKDGADAVTVNSTGPATTVLGGGGNDTFVVNAVGSAGITLDGQADSDDYTVNFGALSGIVNVADTPPANVFDRLFVNGTSNADVLFIAPSFVKFNGTQTVNYSGIEQLKVDAGAGNDDITVDGTSVPTTVLGGIGDDSFTVNGAMAAPLTLDGGPGNDSLLLKGTSGDDVIILTDTSISGLGAGLTYTNIENLAIDAGAGNDLVDGSALTRSVTIFGGPGNDTLIGGSNNDKIYGQGDDDDLIGNLGNDYLDGGDGSDGLVGDKGTIVREVVTGPASLLSTPDGKVQALINVPGTIRRNITLIDEGQGGDDILVGGSGNDYLHGGAGNDKLDGNDGADVAFGDAGNDQVFGGAGNDHLYGGAGNDLLDGQGGADIAYGGDGDDHLIADQSGDVLIDWFGNFNAFDVPGPGYGSPTIVRSPSPWLQDFLLKLAGADGAANANAEIRIVIPGGDLQQSNSGKGGLA